MAQKKDNKLFKITIGDDVFYYTSATKAGQKLNMYGPSVAWATAVGNSKKINGKIVLFELVDGSDIPYKMINNI